MGPEVLSSTALPRSCERNSGPQRAQHGPNLPRRGRNASLNRRPRPSKKWLKPQRRFHPMSPSDNQLAAVYVGDANHVDGELIEDPLDLTDTLQNVPVLPRRRPASQANVQRMRALQEQRLLPGRTLREIHEVTPLRIIARR